MNAAELKRFRILQELSEEERESIEEILEERPLCDNETLFAEGDEAESLVLIETGELMISAGTESGVASAGATLGECALFAFGTRKVRAVSRGTTSVA